MGYTYDANGNRLSKTVNGTVESYTYDLADKMLTAGAKSYTYDAAGRTVGINAPSGTTTLTYDYESRVTAITGPGINETHTYNGLDTRVGTVQGGVSRTFVRDGSYVTDPVLRDGQATYTPGVSERRSGVSTWSHSGLKNADAQTSVAGAIQATRVYDAFGAELSATGTWKGPFGYAGGFGYQEDSSGLKLLGHRYYDPTTGRFLSRDPIKDGSNWYVYCASDPLSQVDPTGHSFWGRMSSGLIAFISIGSGMHGSRVGDDLHIIIAANKGSRKQIGFDHTKLRKPPLRPPAAGSAPPPPDPKLTPPPRGAGGNPGAGRTVPSTGSPGSQAGGRSPGSGGAISSFLTIAIALSALAEGMRHVIGWALRIRAAEAQLDRDVDDETVAEREAFAQSLGAVEP